MFLALGLPLLACSSGRAGDDASGSCIGNTAGLEVVNESGIDVHVQAGEVGFLLKTGETDREVVPAGKAAIVVSENRVGYPILESTQADFECGKTHHFTVLPLPPVELAVTIDMLPNLGGEIGYGVVTSMPPGIDCSNDGTSSTCAALFPRGTSVTLSAAPDPGSRFNPAFATAPTTYVLEQDTSVQESFVPAAPSIALEIVGRGAVRTSPVGTPCSACGSDDSFFVNGTDVTLDAVPEQGAVFSGFSGACSGSTCSIHVDGTTHDVTAKFAAESEVLTIAKTGTGTGTVRATGAVTTLLTCGATCTATVSYGDDVTLDATPDSGSSFVKWTGGCFAAPTDPHCALSIEAATTITAELDSP